VIATDTLIWIPTASSGAKYKKFRISPLIGTAYYNGCYDYTSQKSGK
jgi:hypothetical protein